MKIALVHDWLNNLSGAERVLFELHKIFPKAPIYTLFQNNKFTSQYLLDAEIKTSFLQKIPGASIDVPWFRWWFMILYYAVLGFYLFRTSK